MTRLLPLSGWRRLIGRSGLPAPSFRLRERYGEQTVQFFIIEMLHGVRQGPWARHAVSHSLTKLDLSQAGTCSRHLLPRRDRTCLGWSALVPCRDDAVEGAREQVSAHRLSNAQTVLRALHRPPNSGRFRHTNPCRNLHVSLSDTVQFVASLL